MCIGALARHFGYASMAESATYLTTFVNGTAENRAFRLALAPYFSHVLNAYGVNDISLGRTVEQLLADRAAFAATFAPRTVIGTTIMPYVPSSDGWRTKAGQTLGTNQPKIRTANRAIRAGISGEALVLDTARVVDPFDEDKYVVAADPSATAGAGPCEFIGSISGTVLTVTAIASGTLAYGATLTDTLTGAPYTGQPYAATTVLEQLDGAVGGIGTYRVSFAQAVTSKTMYVGAWATNDGLHGSAYIAERSTAQMSSQTSKITR